MLAPRRGYPECIAADSGPPGPICARDTAVETLEKRHSTPSLRSTDQIPNDFVVNAILSLLLRDEVYIFLGASVFADCEHRGSAVVPGRR